MLLRPNSRKPQQKGKNLSTISLMLLWFGLIWLAPQALAGEAQINSCRALVVAFVGGLGTAHFPPTVTSPVLNELQSLGRSDVCVKRVSTYWPWSVGPWVASHLRRHSTSRDANEQPETDPPIIVFAYSLGVLHALRFARMLERQGTPLELLVTVDSKGFRKGIIPGNVKTAANYYERQLYPFFYPLYYGKRKLQPEVPRSTNFLGNIQVEHAGHFTIVTINAVRSLLADAVRDGFAETGPANSDMGH